MPIKFRVFPSPEPSGRSATNYTTAVRLKTNILYGHEDHLFSYSAGSDILKTYLHAKNKSVLRDDLSN